MGPFTAAYRSAVWGLCSSKRAGEPPTLVRDKHTNPDEHTNARTRSRNRNVSFRMRRAHKHVGGLGARETGAEKKHHESAGIEGRREGQSG